MQAETGKVRADAALETPYLADAINFYGENAPTLPRRRARRRRTCRCSGSAG